MLNQPSQSLVANVYDACMFSMKSKKASWEQEIAFGSEFVRDEEWNNTVIKALNDVAHLPTIARVLTGHSQIVSVIIENKKSNDYLQKGQNDLWSAMQLSCR